MTVLILVTSVLFFKRYTYIKIYTCLWKLSKIVFHYFTLSLLGFLDGFRVRFRCAAKFVRLLPNINGNFAYSDSDFHSDFIQISFRFSFRFHSDFHSDSHSDFVPSKSKLTTELSIQIESQVGNRIDRPSCWVLKVKVKLTTELDIEIESQIYDRAGYSVKIYKKFLCQIIYNYLVCLNKV